MRITVLTGNPKPDSRTRRIVDALASRVADELPVAEVASIDLAGVADRLFRWPDAGLARLTTTVADSDLLVVGSPTYKATYTGLLKAFLDRYPNNGLAGVCAVPVMTGSSEVHALAVETALRPLLVELGASVPSRGLYFVMDRMHRLDTVLDDWWQANRAPLLAALGRVPTG
ncbi:NADPH-dependent FMN reductase [Nakamurella leprariae]|uniref:NAD(P)H-dependent oxidoreductase n=1 Tax=Nakamurella leprariae TaxID=2803911 RepID=A0A938YBL6_9ACTN|nr:NAD(P)H-dependent oxidoreductase [Nakamurella leprariae]MBM9466648.1 NAD(P)H-dependent oxidoreductase [Nakamurella leprariae]